MSHLFWRRCNSLSFGAIGTSSIHISGKLFSEIFSYLELFSNYLAKILFSGTAIIIIGFAGVLYPLWPQQLRGGVYYLSWGGLGFVGFVIVLAIRKFFTIDDSLSYISGPPFG